MLIANIDRFLLNPVENLCSEVKQIKSSVNIILRIFAVGCVLDKMVKLDILLFKSLSFLIHNAAACYILNFTCGKLTVFVMILLLILIWNVWSLILKVTFGKGTLPCTKPYILICLCMECI